MIFWTLLFVFPYIYAQNCSDATICAICVTTGSIGRCMWCPQLYAARPCREANSLEFLACGIIDSRTTVCMTPETTLPTTRPTPVSFTGTYGPNIGNQPTGAPTTLATLLSSNNPTNIVSNNETTRMIFVPTTNGIFTHYFQQSIKILFVFTSSRIDGSSDPTLVGPITLPIIIGIVFAALGCLGCTLLLTANNFYVLSPST